MSRGGLLLFQLLVALVFFGLWQLLATVPIFGHTVLPPFFFSTPVNVFNRILKWLIEGTIWRHLLVTLTESVLAFLIGSLSGALIGFWFARQQTVAAIFDPYVKMMNALPRVVLAPIFALWLGLGIWSKVALGITLVFFVVFFNVYQGVKEAAIAAACLLAVGAVVDVFIAAYVGRVCRGRRRGRRISGFGGRARLSDPAGRRGVRRRRRICRHDRSGDVRGRDRFAGDQGREPPAGLAPQRE